MKQLLWKLGVADILLFTNGATENKSKREIMLNDQLWYALRVSTIIYVNDSHKHIFF